MTRGMVGVLLLISAPSGAGKTTVCRNLLEACPNLVRVTTCTTRAPREGEVDGQDYFFLTQEDFAERQAQDAFLETAEVYGNSYGTLKSVVARGLQSGHDVLLNIDVQGAALLRQRAATDPLIAESLVTVFLTPPTRDELERRLRTRGSDSEDVIQRRLRAANHELAASESFDYLILSGSMEEDLRRSRCILEAEKMRRSRLTLPEALTERAELESESHG